MSSNHDQDQDQDGDALLDFLDEEPAAGGISSLPLTAERWRVLIVDDEQDVHSVTAFALNNYIYMNKRIEFVSAYNEKEARVLLQGSPDFSLVLLDVVMTTPDAGLNLVKYIREDLNNQQIQIILRTGQPGDIPEEQMVKRYSVNDYKLKTELTREKLFSAVTLSLRSYQQVRELADLNFRLCTANNQMADFNAQLQSLVDQRTAELTHKSHSLADALQDKTNLLRIMAHDLRNYLAIAKWSSDLATRADTPEATTKHLAKVGWAIDKQAELISKVASLEALRSGKQTVTCQSESLKDILDHCLETFEQRLTEKGVSLKIHWLCSDQTRILVDRIIFANSVVNNVVSNAIKFSSAGDAITVDVEPAAAGSLRIRIGDSGIGIPDDVLKALFGFNVQTSRTGTKGERGTGFGMPIAKLLLEKMHGAIDVQSTVKADGISGHGTRVALTVRTAP